MTWGVQRNKSNLVISCVAPTHRCRRSSPQKNEMRHRCKTGIAFYLQKMNIDGICNKNLPRVEQEKVILEFWKFVLWKKASQHVKVSRLRRQRTAMCNKTRRVLAQGSDEIKRENREICNRTLRATQDSRGILSSPFHSLAPATSFLVLRLGYEMEGVSNA